MFRSASTFQKTNPTSIYSKNLSNKQFFHSNLTNWVFSSSHKIFPPIFVQISENKELSINTKLILKRHIRNRPRFDEFQKKGGNDPYKPALEESNYFSSLPTILGLSLSALVMYNFPGVFMVMLLGGFSFGSFKIFQIYKSIKRAIIDTKVDLDIHRDSVLGRDPYNILNLKRDDFPLRGGLGSLINSFFLPIFKNILSASQSFTKASEKLQKESISILLDHISNKTDTGLILISEFGPEIVGSLQFKHIQVSSASSLNNDSNKLVIIFSAHLQGKPLFDVQAQGFIIDTKSDDDSKVEVTLIQLSLLHSHKHLHIPTQINGTHKGFGQVKEAEYREL